ncbi:YraN family protein [Acidomonas methanolica]|uniref:UPF0102 protein Amme_005_081 n=2 Tax=Acidomonas methanolica TaxID=437 RepID=A0A023D0N3_ACIMT|nr:YraN family protein [Acidomonas methanolica]MBU2653367.1 YraN family protein [Acidomonas methanolica]TCS32318.1 putative endonuclease [Acidomonas methanolica]GAJ27693.1 hypothetical protein Amme_005_081 [Acidomonas methanolica NBRC 104435]GEK97755.1 UPF0102 protein [Acidomonas methanolica NBRC 104435]
MRRPQRGQAAWLRGAAAEERAGTLLQAEGFTLLAARLRTPAGELDLVAADDLTLLVVEVKQRATLAAAATALTPRQSARILAGTAWLLATRPDWTRPNTRIDLILFDQAGDARRIRDVLRQMDS